MFHICEGGKKISFLCPNGTIFQQSELICDWWFKVNCAASPGHYAESSEVLSRAQNRTSNHSVKSKPIVKLEKDKKRTKSSEETANDNYDFEDISFPELSAPRSNALNADRRAKAYSQRSQNLQNTQNVQHAQNGQNTKNSPNSQESQVFAASSSFVNAQANNFNGYYYKQPNQNKASNQREPTTQSPQPQATSTTPVTTTTAGGNFANSNNFDGYKYEPDRSSRRFQTAKATIDRNNQATFSTTTLPPITYPNRGTTKYKDTNEQQFIINVADTTARTTPPPLIRSRGNGESTTARYETTRTTPFYTPTVPSVSPPRPVSRNRFQEARPTVSSAKVAEHAMEMMQTIHDLKLDGVSEPTQTKEHDSRSGLVIPPSSGPETLHSLALYFATAVDSLVTKPMPETTTELPIPGLKGLDIQAGNVTKLESSLVSENTKRQYETLFGIDEDDKLVNSKNNANIRDGSNDESNLSNNDLETEFSNNPVIAAAGTKQIRELAQVFTHALSAYLHDPSTFRRVLAEIRPTEPPPVQSTDYLNNRIGRNKDFKDGTGATYLPTSATPSFKDANNGVQTTEDLEVLDFSDVTLSTPYSREQATEINNNTENVTSVPTVDLFDTTRSQILQESLKQVDHVPASRILTEALESYALNQYAGNSLEGTTEPSNPLAIEINGGLEATTTYPYLEDFENSNNTQYQFPSRLTDTEYPNAPTTDYPNNGPTTTSGPLTFDLLPPSSVNKAFEFPKNDIPPPADDNDLQRAQSQSIFGNGKNNLEPHRTGKDYSKNDIKSLKNENGHYITEITPTVTPASDLSKTTNPDNGKINPNTWSTLSYSVFLDPLTINDGLMSGNEQSTPVPSSSGTVTYVPQSTQTPSYETTYPPFLNTDNRHGKAVSPTNGPPTHEDYLQVMQQKANEMFGSLNDTSADHLMNVMKKADKNKTVRKLILLLIQTCDDDYNKTVEQSRQALLNALIGMDGKTDDGNEIQTIQTIRAKPYHEEKAIHLNSPSSQNAIPTTTTQLPITTYHRPLNLRLTESSTYPTHFPPQNAALNVETTTFSPLFQSTNYFTDTTATPNYDYTTTSVYSTDVDTTTTTYYQPPTTTMPPTTTTTTTRAPTTIKSRRRTTQAPLRNSKRLAKDLDQYLAHQGDTNLMVNQSHRNSDARALELLRSLYSLAGRFGK